MIVMFDSAYVMVVVIGILHGLEPGHGWPIAFLYSVKRDNPLYHGFISSGLIAVFHLISSLAVVTAYALLSSLFTVSTSLMKYAAAVLLLLLAYRIYTENVKDEFEAQHGHLHGNKQEIEHVHEHEHPKQCRHTHSHKHAKSIVLSLWGIATFAFILGFAHEEEFALLALAVGGVNPWMLMVSYATAVTVALIGVTLACIKAYERLLPKIGHYQKYILKMSAIPLLIMATVFILGLA